MGITVSMYLALSTCILFISLMESVNGGQFLSIIFFLLFGAATAPVFRIVVVPLTCPNA